MVEIPGSARELRPLSGTYSLRKPPSLGAVAKIIYELSYNPEIRKKKSLTSDIAPGFLIDVDAVLSSVTSFDVLELSDSDSRGEIDRASETS